MDTLKPIGVVAAGRRRAARTRSKNSAVSASGSPHTMNVSIRGASSAIAASDPPPP